MTNLVRRHIATTEVCSACQAQPEDTLHALWSCTKLELVWSSFSWSLPSANAHALSFQELLHRYMQIKEDYRAQIFVIIAWMLWNRRNALRLNLQVQPLNRISSLAGSYLQEFLDVQDQTPTATCPSLPQQWQPPDENKFKVNFDVAVFKSCNQAGLGVIVRDWRGEAIGALSTSVPAAQTVVELEALACCRAVLFAVELGLQDVVFEGDSLQVIQALNLDSTDHLTYIMATFSRISELKLLLFLLLS